MYCLGSSTLSQAIGSEGAAYVGMLQVCLVEFVCVNDGLCTESDTTTRQKLVHEEANWRLYQHYENPC